MATEADPPIVSVGLTGGIGCGKSTVAAILADRGVAVLDTDDVAHEVMAPGGAAYAAVLQAFGDSIVDGDGVIDRPRLAEKVFQDERERERLNGCVHPAVRRVWEAWMRERRGSGVSTVVVIPLLFEVGATEGWDAILCVSADEDVVRERLRDRGLSEVEIDRRLAAQWPIGEKRRLADHVIENSGSLDDLTTSVNRQWQAIINKEMRHDG